jgi:hypothetical protein
VEQFINLTLDGVSFRSPHLFYLLTEGVKIVYFHLITFRHAPQSVGLLWARDRPVAETSTWPHMHSQQTNIHYPVAIRTHNPSKLLAADLRLRSRGHGEPDGVCVCVCDKYCALQVLLRWCVCDKYCALQVLLRWCVCVCDKYCALQVLLRWCVCDKKSAMQVL